MKKKILVLIGILTVILSFGYSAKADTCTYNESSFPSKTLINTCNSICKNGLVDSSQKMKCDTWCSSKTHGLSIDKSCYCLSQSMPSEGAKCYEGGIKDMLKQNGMIVDEVKYIENENKEVNDKAMQAACEAIADCSKGDYSTYINKYKGCMNNNITCNTDTTCGQKLCELDSNKKSKYCLTGAFSPTQYCKLANSNVTSSGAGNNGTAGTIKEDLNYISNITLNNCFGFGEIVYYTSLVIKILQIVAPIILIIWASIDLFKSMIAGDEKKILEMRKPIIQRFVSAALVFLVPWIVSTIVNNFSSNADWLICWKKNRFTYSRENDKGGTYVNSIHNVQNEQGYIKFSCTQVCASGSNFDDCKEKCMNTYWESAVPCYNYAPSNGSTKPDDINAARISCYNEFANEFYNRYSSQSGN